MNDSGGQTLRVHFNQFAEAPIERVYAAYIDPALLSTLMGLKAITDVSGPLDRPGATFVGVVFGPYRPRSEVLAAEAAGPPPQGGAGGSLGIAGGAIVAILVVVVAFDPNSGAWFAFFLVVTLLGAAVLGFENRTRVAPGQLGRASAWMSAVG